MRFIPCVPLVLAVACATAVPAGRVGEPDFGWRRPTNDYETKFREAAILAEQIMRHPRCMAEFKKLPDWPTGRVLTEVVYGGPVARTTLAFTNMGEGRIYVLVETLRWSSVEYAARTLIHELAHVASKGDFDPMDDLDPEKDAAAIVAIKRANEVRVQEVTRICTESAGIA